jgi:hypothetical protein
VTIVIDSHDNLDDFPAKAEELSNAILGGKEG